MRSRVVAPRSSVSGFTLLEVMLALAILGFLTTIMWGAFSQTVTNKRAIEASQDRLSLRLEAADDATLERTQGVVIDHLKRFAFREELGEVQWERG